MSDVAILINTTVAVAAVVLMIVRFKFNPVVSLVVGSAYLGLTTGLGTAETVEVISTGFGDIMAEVGLLIAFGVLMGAMLKEMGAIQRLVGTLLRVFGPKRMPYALSLTIATLLQSIFLDVLLVISAPLARNLAPKVGRVGTARMATALAIGLECGIVLMVPGVGALALAGLLGVPLGKMLIFGLILVIPTVAISVAIMSFLFTRGWWNPEKDEEHFHQTVVDDEEDQWTDGGSGGTTPRPDAGGGVAQAQRAATVTEVTAGRAAHDRPLILLLAPLLVSLLLIATGAVLDIAEISNPVVSIRVRPLIALLIGLIGTSFVGRLTVGQHRVEKAIASGFSESGQILILTGVGGSLAADHRRGRSRRHPRQVLHRQSRRSAADGVGDRRRPARRRRLGDHLRDHRRGHPRPDRPDPRPRPRPHRPRRRRRLPVRGARHQQHVLAAAVLDGSDHTRHAEDVFGGSIGGIGRRNTARSCP